MAASALPKVLAVLRELTKPTAAGVELVDVRRVAVEAGLSEETARHHLGTLLHRGQASRDRHGQRFTYRAVFK
jgi:DNA-binding IclR family transcriptional regulator